MVIRPLICGRSVGHENFCIVANDIQHLGDCLLLLLNIERIRSIGCLNFGGDGPRYSQGYHKYLELTGSYD